MSDTIYALSTPPGRGGVAVIRASGPQSWDGARAMMAEGVELPAPRMASTRTLWAPSSPQGPTKREKIDHAMIIVFKGPHSFTGEDCVEYHVHGGMIVVQTLLSALSTRPHHRMAEPGEFTRRAFEMDKMDLTEAEAVADLIHAETEAQQRQALMQMEGALSALYHDWKNRLAHILAMMEADLDFSDQDLPDDLLIKIKPDVGDVIDEISHHLNDNRRGEMLRDGVKLVVVGAPNAGKSSLINLLAQRDVAIVSPHAGTTRDVIDVHLNLNGYPVILSDTAGLRPEKLGKLRELGKNGETGEFENDAHDAIERVGIERALSRARAADVKIILFDGASSELDRASLNLYDDSSLMVINKCDISNIDDHQKLIKKSELGAKFITISVKENRNIDELLAELGKFIAAKIGLSETPCLTRARHRESLQQAKSYLMRSMTAPLPELAAEDLRLSIRYLGRITGHVDVEDLLDMIFRDFCIGK